MAQVRVSAISKTVNADDGFPLTVYELFKGKKYEENKHPMAIFFYIQGSEYNSVTTKIDMLASTVILGGKCIVMEKRGCYHDHTDSAVAFRFADKNIRVNDHLGVIREFTKTLADSIPVIVIGGSEGGDVAAVVAEKEKRITNLILIGSAGGWSQKSEFQYLVSKYPGYLGCNNVQALDSVLNAINKAIDESQMWAGHPFKRWKSFFNDSNLIHLKNVNIPVLLLHGTADTNVPVEAARALKDAFVSLKKNNLTYLEYPDVDHRMYNVKDQKSRYPFFELDIINWLSSFKIISETEAKSFAQRVKKAHKDLFE